MPENVNTKYVSNPYPGIRSFNVNESKLFYGREKQISDISILIKEHHFVAISGASGSGKSSIVKAGIIPWFLNEYENADYVIFRPGNNPFKNLSDSLTKLFEKEGYERKEIKKILSILNKEENALESIFIDFKTQKDILLYIDQFEEIFRFRSSEELSKSVELSDLFIQNIINAVNSDKVNINLIFSLRSDFLSECAVFEGLPELINKGHYLLPSMSIQQKEDAIIKPAEFVGTHFSPELLEIIKDHIGSSRVSLPVLQHTLMRTWENWLLNAPPGSQIDIKNYEAIGTVHKALSYHAEDIYNSLNDKQKVLTEKIFRALTFWRDNERGVRSPQKLSDLIDITGAREMELIEVIDKFRAEGNSFLLPSSDEQINLNSVIDISHESIMLVWKRLSEWVEKETQAAQLYLRLSKTSELYQAGKTGILVNPDLQIAINWLENDNPNSAWAKRYDPAFDRVVNFIYYSRKEYEKDVAAALAKQERSLKRTRFIALILGVASLVSIFLTIVSLNLRFKAVQSEKDALLKQKIAERQSLIAEERRKDAVALQLVASQQQRIAEQNRIIAERQKQYAVEQQREALFQKLQAIKARNEAIDAMNLARKLQIEAENLRDEAIEQRLIIEEQKKRAELSEARTDTLRRLAISQTMAVKAYKMYFDNLKATNLTEEDLQLPSILALQAYYFNIKNKGKLYNPDIFAALLAISQKTKELDVPHTDAVRALYVYGQELYSAGSDGQLFYIDMLNEDEYTNINTQNLSNIDLRSLTVNNKYIFAGTKDGRVLMWKKSNLKEKAISKSQSDAIIVKMKFINENQLIVADKSGNVVSYNVNDITFVQDKEVNVADEIVDFEIFRKNIFVSTKKGNVYILSDQLDTIRDFKTPYENISCMNISNSGSIYFGYTNGLVEITNDLGIEIDKWFAHNSAVTKILLANEIKKIITSGYDKKIKIWEMDDLTSPPVEIDVHNDWIYSLAISFDEKNLISADAGGKIKITLIDINELKNEVRKGITKNMSKLNWDKYVGKDIEYSPELPEDL